MYQAMDPITTTEETRLSPILDQEEEEDDDDFKTCSSSSRSERTSYSNITNSSSSSSSSSEELSEELFESEEEDEEEEEFNIVPLNLPTMVERENRKNIVKTLQGQADIITNWSLTTRESDGRSVWTLMEGKPYTFASKFHSNVITTTTTIRSSTLGGTSSNSSSMSLSNNMNMGCASLSSRLEALVDLSNEIDNDINDLSRISSSTSRSSSSASSSGAASFNISNVTDEESKSLLNESALSSGPSGGAVEEDTSGIGSSVKEEGKKERVYPCQKCDTLLNNKYYWYKHMIMEHGREDRARNADVLFDCRFCEKQFGQKRSRDAHVKTHAYRNAQQQPQETSESSSSSSPSSSSSALMNQVTPV